MRLRVEFTKPNKGYNRIMSWFHHFGGIVCVLLACSLAPLDTYGQITAPAVTWQEINRTPPAADARISYGQDSLMFGDLRLPRGEGPHPVVIVIHGGCWRAENDLNHISHLSEALRGIGVATWTLEYRRVGNPGGGWPGTFRDIIAGANHLLGLGEQYRLDLDRVTLLGHSAGGHLALWLAAHRNQQNARLEFPRLRVPIESVISLAGITDLRTFGEGSAYCNASVAPFLGGAADELAQRYADSSPAQMNALGIPALLLHGETDPYVPLSQAESFRTHARSQGDAVRIVVVSGAGHFDVIAPFSRFWPEVKRLIETFMVAPKRP
jgi:acetyl esterase/lipase